MILDKAQQSDNATTGAAPTIVPVAADGAPVMLPAGVSLATAEFNRVGADLVVATPEGQDVIVRDFFTADPVADLMAPDGTRMSGSLVTSLAGPVAPGQVAQAGTLAAGEPIGEVDNVDGQVFATRADGTRVELHDGDAVYMGDVVETAVDGAVGIVLADGTAFAMAQNGRMVLDEMIYDPSVGGGSISLSFVQGLFSLVSGEIAKADPDAMVVETPVATIGIRGTQIGLDLSEPSRLGVVLMEELSGFVGEVVVSNGAGLVVMNMAHQYTYVGAVDLEPTAVSFINVDQLRDIYKSALSHLPQVGGIENRYESPTDADDLASFFDGFETAAGTDNGPAGGFGGGTVHVVDGDYTQRTDIPNQPLGNSPAVSGGGPQGKPASNDNTEAAFFGAGGGDVISGSEGDDDLAGNEGDDIIIGGDGDDILDGGAGNDILTGNGGDDSLLGGDGDDLLNGGTGSNRVDGGSGVDMAVFMGSYMDYTVQIDAGAGTVSVINGEEDISDVLTNVELLQFAGDGEGQGGGVVAVEAIGLAPTVVVTTGTAVEDMAFSLDIGVTLAHSLVGVASVVLSGLPEDAILESGTEGLLLPREDGSYLLDPDLLTGLSVTPPQHFNGDLAGMQVTVTTTEGVSAQPVSFAVSVLDINDAPYLALNAGLEVGAGETAVIGEDLLAVADVDDPADAIVYEVTGLPQHGALYLGTTALDLGGTFTQFDIDSGLLTYEQLNQELEAGTYLAGLSGRGRPDPVDSWGGVDVYAFASGNASHLGEDGRLDLAQADSGMVYFSQRGLGVLNSGNGSIHEQINYDTATGGSESLAIGFRADVDEARIEMSYFFDNQNERANWEAFDANGQLVGSGALNSSNVVNSGNTGQATIQVDNGAAFRYLVVQAESTAGSDGGGASNFYVRSVEYDVVPGPSSDTFSFRAEDGQHLALADNDSTEPGYTVVDGEAHFNITIDQNLAA